MNDKDLQQLWQACDEQLAQSKMLNMQSWIVNLRTMESLQQYKTETMLKSLARFKIRAAILGILYCLFLAVLVYGNRFRNPYFTISVGAILLFNIAAVIIYVRHVIMIYRLDYSKSVMHTQAQLSELESSTVGLRFLWLQMPFYSTFFWGSWIHFDSAVFFFALLLPTLLLSFLGYWIYRYTTPEHMHKKWVRMLLMAGPEYSSVIKARKFLEEIEDFRKELA